MVTEKVVSNIHHANNKKIQQRGMRGKLWWRTHKTLMASFTHICKNKERFLLSSGNVVGMSVLTAQVQVEKVDREKKLKGIQMK